MPPEDGNLITETYIGTTKYIYQQFVQPGPYLVCNVEVASYKIFYGEIKYCHAVSNL
jgi:hypothetical protein